MVIKEHLDQNGRPDPVAQLKYCSENNCPDCTYCLCASDMLRFTKPTKNKPIKAKIIETKVEVSKFDVLAKKLANVEDFDHPLYKDVVRLFLKK
tara:strand:+ start:104 stop:385 length:282 start_codon:yes stop_codon:yes gene_type:complete